MTCKSCKDKKTYSNKLFASNYKERLKICSKCPLLSDKGFCQICGCYVKFKAKIKFFGCPDGKW